MRRFFAIYRALLRIRLVEALEYRAQIMLWLLEALVPLIMMNVWLAAVDEAGPAAGWGRADFIAYYVGVALVHELTSSWAVWDWEDDIRKGDLSIQLLKPIDPFHHYFSRYLAYKLFNAMILIPAVALAAWLLPDLDYPLDPWRVVGFAFSVGIAFMLSTLISTTFGMLSFWTTQSTNLFGVWYGISHFLSGWIAPLSLFPVWFGSSAAMLPFRYTLGFPIDILTGRINSQGIVAGFAVAGAWILVFGLAQRVLWRRGLVRYEAVGA